ncbi:MAG: hypothetical protein GY940_35895 [bacterium]|nr:hypothetical protein [bacterium]
MEQEKKEKKEQLVVKTKVLRYNDLVHKLKDKAKSLSKNPNYNKEVLKQLSNLLEKLDQLRRKKRIRINLEIPRELARRLGNNSVLQVDGIIRQTVDVAIDQLVLNSRPSGAQKLLQVKNISFMALDTMEAILLDRKLTDISEKVDSIDAKLDAQHKGTLKSAMEQMKELTSIRNPDTRKNKIPLIQDRLSFCEHLFIERYENKWQNYITLNGKFEKSTFSNKSKLKEMCQIGQQFPELMEPVILCKVGQVKLYQMQQEFSLALEKAFELADFVAGKLEDFKTEFSAASLESKNYKNIADFNRAKTITMIKEQLIGANEHMEHLLNTTISFVLTIPEEVSKYTGNSKKIKKDNAWSMNMDQRNVFDAPWSTGLKVITVFSILILIGTMLVGLLIGPRETLIWTISMVALPGIILVVMPFFAINGYTVTPQILYVNRPGRQSKIPLETLQSAEFDPGAMNKSFRTFGNGGFFSFSGKFRNKKLGSYRAFVTDTARSVVLKFFSPGNQNQSIIVVSPGDPQRFISEINRFKGR